MYKNIIWDFDGTLFNTYPVMANIFKDTLERKGIEEPLNEIVKQMKVSMSSAFNYYENKYRIDSNFLDEYHIRRKEAEMQQSKPFEGIVDICKYIYSTNRQNYLYTHRGESAIKLLKMFGLYDYFSDFITLEHGFERKPSPDALHHLINKHNMSHSESIMIGDRDLDILAAHNAGITACYFTEGDEISNHADYNISDFKQLYSII
ncbi:HAD-IA family hydrolase [Bacillus carboniphilus]|uniref:HAD-IA family hydrolase n=1 Tax=Bacillus carboniphilus TaxID=86663 RepID=A0ABY9JVU1_9BACI|nr:HAD-IA family hydrolase [Bacillus carboniphilus]WLR42393.1 HAD-IA family hydrolase [Bacillus carboniphilus]